MGETLRQLKIKTGVVRRLKKELGMYAKELEGEKSRVQQMKDAGADPFDVKQAVSRRGPGRRGPLTLTGLRRRHPPPLAGASDGGVGDDGARLQAAAGDRPGGPARPGCASPGAPAPAARD